MAGQRLSVKTFYLDFLTQKRVIRRYFSHGERLIHLKDASFFEYETRMGFNFIPQNIHPLDKGNFKLIIEIGCSQNGYSKIRLYTL